MNPSVVSNAGMVDSSIAGAVQGKSMGVEWRNRQGVKRFWRCFRGSLSNSFGRPSFPAYRNQDMSPAAKASGVQARSSNTRPLQLLDRNSSIGSSMVDLQGGEGSSFCSRCWFRSSQGEGEQTGENKTLHVEGE